MTIGDTELVARASDDAITLFEEEEVVADQNDLVDEAIEVTRDIDNLPQEIQDDLNRTYSLVVKKKLNEKLKAQLKYFLDKLKDSKFEELQRAILSRLSEEDLQLYQTLNHSNTQDDLTYESTCKLYKAIRAGVKACEDDHTQAEYHAAYKVAGTGLDTMYYMVNYDVPSIIGNAKKIAIMQETRFERIPKKKSLFRRFLEAVFPFLEKKESKIVIKRVNQKIPSHEKAVLGIATEVIAEHFMDEGKSHFQAFENAVDYVKEARKGKAVSLLPTTEQVQKQNELKTKKQQANQGTVNSAVAALKTVAKVVGTVESGINEWIGSKYKNTRPGAYLEYFLHPDEQVTQSTLTEHFRNEFILASQRQTFDGIMKFAQHLAEIYLTANRANANGVIDVDPKQFGFKRINDPKFEVFMLRLIKSLGFPANGYNDLMLFLNNTVDPNILEAKSFPSYALYEKYKADLSAAQNQAFTSFAGALANDPTLGIHAALTHMSKEHKQALTNNKGNENYFYLLNFQQQTIEELRAKERLQGAVALVFREFSLEEKVYSPNEDGLTTIMSGQLKRQLVNRMPEFVGQYLDGARQMQDHVESQFKQMSDNFLEHLSRAQQEAVRANRETKPNKGLSVAELQERWDKSAQKTAKIAFQFEEVKELVEKFNKGAMQEWTNAAIPFVMRCAELGGPGFIQEVLGQLKKDHDDALAKGTHDSHVIAIDRKMSALTSMLTPEGENFDIKLLKSASPDMFKLAFDALNTGVESMLTKENNYTLDEKETLFMMSQALGTMGASYRTFDLAKKAYDEVYRTHYDTFDQMPATKAGKYIAEKLGAYLEKTLASTLNMPMIQFEYYAKQKILGRHNLDDKLPRKEVPPVPAQGWMEWGMGYVSSAMGYLAPVGVKAIEVAALPLLLGAGSYYMARLYRTNVVPDPKSFNQAVCDNAKVFIREQAYDAIASIIPQMYNIHAAENRFQQNHADLNYDAFKQCGMCDRTRFYGLMDNLAKAMGFDNINDYMQYQSLLNNKIAVVDRCKQELQATWIYKSEPQAKLEKAQGELLIVQNILADKRKRFAMLPETQQQLNEDLFVSLKDAIQTEFAQVTAEIENGKFQDGTNYLVLLSSFNTIIQQVELVQRETIALELFSPDVDKMIGYDSQATGVMAQLKIASREEMKSYGTSLVNKGILSQITQSIQSARYFSDQMMTAVISDLSSALQQIPYRQAPVAAAYNQLRNAPVVNATADAQEELVPDQRNRPSNQ